MRLHDNKQSKIDPIKQTEEGDKQSEIERLFKEVKEYSGEVHIENIHGWDIRYIGDYRVDDLFDVLFGGIVKITLK